MSCAELIRSCGFQIQALLLQNRFTPFGATSGSSRLENNLQSFALLSLLVLSEILAGDPTS